VRKAALICATATVAALPVAGAEAAARPGLRPALARTAHAPSLHYRLRVRIVRDGTPLALHVRGQASRSTISIRLQTGDGRTGAALLDGPFLYELAPNGLVVVGKIRWLRVSLRHLSARADELKAVHAMTPAPLLRVLGEAHLRQAGARLYRGAVAYDDPIVRTALARLTNRIEFRQLRVSAFVGRDGLVHRVLLTGRTADGKTTLAFSARLFAFGRPVHVSPPAPGTFMDEGLAQLQS
jgi:hypothetical protein